MIAEAVRHMLAAGMSHEAVVAAIADMEASQPKDAAADRRRAWDRERKRAAREVERLSTGSPPESADNADNADTPPTLDKKPQTQKINPTPGEHTHTGARGAASWICPEGVDRQHWNDFLTNRRTKRLGYTLTAYQAQLKTLTQLADDEWPPGRIVEFAAARGWGAIFDPRGRDDGNGADRRNTGSTGRPRDGFMAALHDAAGLGGAH